MRPFWRKTMHTYSATGNTFLILWEESALSDQQKTAFTLANAGSLDGVIFAGRDSGQFRMDYFNRDGSRGQMCGNGARAFIRFLHDEGEIEPQHTAVFHTFSGTIEGMILEDDRIMVQMPPVIDHGQMIVQGFSGIFLTIGVPHFVIEAENLETQDLLLVGPSIRHDNSFREGTNVNFFQKISPSSIRLRTYERGVESETLACGTGTCACAWVAKAAGIDHIHAKVPGGDLEVRFIDHRQYLIGHVNRLCID